MQEHRGTAGTDPHTPKREVIIYQTAVVSSGGSSQQAGRDIVNIHTRDVRFEEVRQGELDEATSRFAPPREFSAVRACLTEQHLAVVIAPEGTGRRTVALNLLAQLTGGKVVEVLPDWDRPDIELIPVAPEYGILLDLDVEEKFVDPRFGQQLRLYSDELRNRRSYLVITASRELWSRCADVANDWTIPIGRPSAEDVLIRHLHKNGRELLPRTAWCASVAIKDLLSEPLLPVDVVRLAHMLLKNPDDDAGCKDALGQYQRWREYLTEWFKTHGDPETRAFMITAALLNGSPVEVLLEAWSALCNQLALDQTKGGGLAGPGIAEMVHAIEGERLNDTISITGRRPSLDEALLEYIWLERPALRKDLKRWISKLAGAQSPVAAYQGRVADSLADLALHVGIAGFLDIVTPWLGGTQQHRSVATRMLEKAAVDPQEGSRIRRTLYRWARDSNETSLLKAVGDVCAGELRHAHFAQALTRVRVLFERDSVPAARQAASTAIRVLAADGDRGLRLAVLDSVLKWIDEPSWRKSGVHAFWALCHTNNDWAAAPWALARDALESDEVATLFRKGWSMASAESERTTIEPVLQSWLDSLSATEQLSDFVVSVVGPVMREGIFEDSLGSALTGGRNRGIRERIINQYIAPRRSDSNGVVVTPELLEQIGALSGIGATAIVRAMATDAWGSVKARVARFLGLGDDAAFAREEADLEASNRAMATADDSERQVTTAAQEAEIRGSLRRFLIGHPGGIGEFAQLVQDIQTEIAGAKDVGSYSVVQNAKVSGGSSIQAGRDYFGGGSPQVSRN